MALLSSQISMSSSFSKFSSFLSLSPSWEIQGLLRAESSRRFTPSINICMSDAIPKHVAENKAIVNDFGRKSFPRGFTFGAASSAYQIEGAWNEGGKGPSIWDTFTHQFPERIIDRSNGDIAVDSYHRYKEDVKLLKDMNMDAYRFSISWSRILPKGSLKGGKNQEGINYYHKLIDELIKNGITPYITLFHWDVPQELENDYQGFLSRRIVNDFKDYCEVCFKEFGSKVKHWITLNEPSVFTTFGYSSGIAPPGRCSKIHGCLAGNSMTEPYIVGHNQILAHAAAASLYKDKYQAEQGGEIGLALQSFWYIPFDEVFKDFEAVNRALDFSIAWFMDPLVNGDYPFIMRAIVRERLPTFTEEEKRMIIGSFDFIGINYYTARYVKGIQHRHDPPPFDVHYKECFAEELSIKNGAMIGAHNGDWLYVYPEGLNELMRYIKQRYDNPPIYVTENGYGDANANELTEEELRADEKRKEYIEKHLLQTHHALRMGVNIKGFFVWSLTDNFEWGNGYTTRFGVNYVDYDNLMRYPKYSAEWLSDFLRK